MENKGMASAISELGDTISDLRAVVEDKNLHIDELIKYSDRLSLDVDRKLARIKELEDRLKQAHIKEVKDRLSKRPERIKREDQGLNKWNK